MRTPTFYDTDFLVIDEDIDVLRESVKRIIMTSPGERVNNPLFGCKLKRYLFDFETYLEEDIKGEILNSITRWEPRVEVTSILITKESDFRFSVIIDCQKKNSAETFSIDTVFSI